MDDFATGGVETEREMGNVPASRDRGRVPVTGDALGASHPGPDDPFCDADSRHRREFANYAKQNGHQPYREPMSRLYASWEGWNDEYFDGQLLPPHFLLAEPKSPRALGDHSLLSGWGSTNQIRIRPSILNGTHPAVRPDDEFAEGRFRLILDIAIHETGHQYATEILKQQEEGYRGHGPVFRDLCNRIGARLGLPPVRTAKARGRDRDRPSCAEWPICVRPKGFYLGAYRPHDEMVGGAVENDAQAPEPPKLLAEWIADHPKWAEQYGRFGEAFFDLLDRFFGAYPAPNSVQEQAVVFLAKSYRHHTRTRSRRRLALPAPVSG